MEHKLITEYIICFLIGFTPGIILFILVLLGYICDKWIDWRTNRENWANGFTP